MTNEELKNKLSQLVRDERKITNEILGLINLALDRRCYLELGYSSMFDWLVKGFGYSSSAACRRIDAAKLLRAVPEATEKLENGKVNLSTLSKVQTIIRHQKQATGQKISVEAKQLAVDVIENMSVIESEQALTQMFPEAASTVRQERHTVIDSTQIRIQTNLSNETIEDLKQAKNLLSHKFPNASDADFIAYALKQLVLKLQPKQKETASRVTTAAGVKSKAGVRRLKLQMAERKCTFSDPVTGQTCGSTYQVELDHIVPRALGGGDGADNLRVLCKQHNLFMAERVFGKKLIDQYRRS